MSQRKTFLEGLSDTEATALWYDWAVWARSAQTPPAGDWRVWLIKAGRGFGKSRTGAEWIRAQVESGACRRLALVGRTAADVRDVMVEGESGILAISPPWMRPKYEPSKRRLTWPNGAIATTYSADKPDALRGPQHDGVWADELASWRFPDAWDQLLFGLRLGTDPRVIVTTTPRATKLIKDLFKERTTSTTGGSTYDNANNLAPAFIDKIVQRYKGTRLGRQELYAEILDDNPGALWKRDQIDDLRVTQTPTLQRIVVAIDPAATATEDSNETGIIVAGIARIGKELHGYVLDDLSLRASPDTWAKQAVTAFHKLKADRIVAEVNNGGDMVKGTVSTVDKNVPYKAVHASRGKQARAEPITALYEQNRIHHVGMFPELEDQMCQWTQGDPSPDRIDALVWAFTELMLGDSGWSRGAA